MATSAPPIAGPAKLSFAKVAAAGTKDTLPPRVAVPTFEHRRAPSSSIPPPAKNKSTSPTALNKTPIQATAPLDKLAQDPPDAKIVQTLKDLSLSPRADGQTTPSLIVNGSSPAASKTQSKPEGATNESDDASQKAESSSEPGTKAPSLDGKSVTSATTFALDEKESLRPDDSASMIAATEDDESFSVRGSQMANSRIGSEIARVHRLRLGDMPERRIVQLLPDTHVQGIATPQSISSGPPPPIETPQGLGTAAVTPDPFSTMYAQNPDEKLLEAMASQKDRIFLLRLEHDLINFVQSSKEPYMDLPPNNSFCRMLTHKLADYYHMTHSFEAVQGAVRIYRTPFCRVPPSLASIASTNISENDTATTPPVVLPRKIMRRGEDDGSGQASTSASKATSEVGSDGREKSDKSIAGKEKLTREQREEAYNKARERIFGPSDKNGEPAPDNEDDNGASRASSVSGKERSNVGKRGKNSKQRRDDSESFDSRSQYTAYYGTHHYMASQSSNWAPQYASAGTNPYNGPVQQPYPQGTMPQPYAQRTQGYPPMMPQGQMSGFPPYGSMPTQFPPQPPPTGPQRFPPAAGPMPTYGSPLQPVMPQQPWPQPAYSQASSPAPAPFQQQPARGPQLQNHQGIPYAYGQLPVNANPNDPKSQHPIPGSYNRHAFNPKTQSFVPSSGMSPVQAHMPLYHMGGPHGSPQMGSPQLAYPAYSPNAPPQPYAGHPPGYGMSRQSSNSSLPAYHHQGTPPQHLPQHPGAYLPLMPQIPPHQMHHGGPVPGKTGPQPANNGHAHPQFTSLPNYGNPATLPQKPPTGI